MGRADGDVQRDALDSLMARMAGGDAGALFEFVDVFHDELAAMVRSVLGSVGRRDVARKASEVDFLVLSAALVVFDRAAGWQRGGAAPWVWAHRAIRGEIVTWLGHPRVEFVPEFHAPGSEPDPVGADINLATLAPEHEELASWLNNVRQVANERDEHIHIEYQTQKSLGDPSPAITVGLQFDLRPDNVRQIDRRVRNRLAELALTSF